MKTFPICPVAYRVISIHKGAQYAKFQTQRTHTNNCYILNSIDEAFRLVLRVLWRHSNRQLSEGVTTEREVSLFEQIFIVTDHHVVL